jgi:autotransporter-associated beta strand protein
LNWSDGLNWSNNLLPGSNASAQNNDVATFNTALGGAGEGGTANPVLIDTTTLNIGGISFTTASVGAYQIGNATNALILSNIGPAYGTHAITISNTAAASQIIAAPLKFSAPSSTNGGFGFVNNATSASNTLTLSGAITANSSGTRPTVLVLDGTNTGANTISGAITSPAFGQNVPLIVKIGAGTWTLSGANAFSSTGSAVTETATGNFGIQILDGVLSVQNDAALGTSGTANNNQIWVGNKSTTYIYNGTTTKTFTSVSGGTLELANNITLNNGLRINLVNGGTLRSSGSTTSNAGVFVNRFNTAAASATISTVGSSDIFTIGNASNDLTGGAADTVLNVSGPGTISLPVASNYAGGWSINDGTVSLGSATGLGLVTVPVGFGASSTGKLQLSGLNVTVGSLSSNATVGTPVVENGVSGTSILTVGGSAITTYAGVLQDGAPGTLALTKSGGGTLELTGANTYTGDTSITAGSLKVNNLTGTSATGTGSVSVNTTGTLTGAGFISGTVTASSGGTIAPGNSVGTLSVGSLTLDASAKLDYEFNTSPANDKIVVTNAAGLTINGGGVNLYEEGGTTQFSTIGNYDLIQYSGGLTGSASNLSVLNPNVTRNYAFSSTGSVVKLAISAATISIWNQSGGGAWGSAGNWTGAGLPNGSGASALFGSSIVAPSAVTLDGNRTLGTIGFDNANSYTIAQGTSGTLYLDNTINAAQAQIINTNGNHVISAPVSLTSDTVASVANAGNTLTMSGGISGVGALIKSGLGTLDLTVANTYSGATTLAGGTTRFVAGALGSSSTLTFNGGTLQWATGNTEDITAGKTVNLNADGAILDTNGNNVLLTSDLGNSGPGALIKTGAGDLDLQGTNTYGGSTTIQQGSITLISDGGLGTDPGSPTANSLVIGNASLRAAGTFTLSSNRSITLGDAATNINVASGETLSSAGTVEGAGTLNLTGSGGTLALTGTKSYTGGTVVTDATLRSNGSLPANIVLNGTGGLTYTGTATVTGLTVNGTNTVADTGGSVILTIASLTAGSGTLNLNHTFVTDFTGSWGTFNGSIVLSGGGGYRFFGSGGSGNVTVDLNGSTLSMRASSTSVAIGALTGSTTSILAGPTNSAQTVTYTVGAKNVSTTYAGAITNSGGGGKAALTKTGTETLTLSGASTYTGDTRVSAGTLAVESTTALGSDVAGTIVDGNDVNSKVTITGSLTLTEPWTLGGRQGANASSPAIVSLSGDNILSGLVTPTTGGNNYNIESAAGTLKMSGDFVPTGSVTGARSLQLQGAAPGEWSGAIQDGTATLQVNCKGTGGWTLSGTNTYTGDTVVDSGCSMVLFRDTSVTGHLKFAPGDNNVCNKVTGDGTATLNGIFDIDLTAANLTTNNEWTLVDVASKTYGVDFAVAGFTKSGSIWTKVDGANTWTFSQTSGKLGLTIAAGFSSWSTTNAGGGTATEDFDKDGVNNAAEWVLGGLGTTNDLGKLPGVSTTGGNLIFTFVRDQQSISADTTVTIETSTDLAGWPNSYAVPSVDTPVGTVTVAKDTPGAGKDTVTLTVPQAPNAKKFAHLKVVITTP